jgi:hypothetical protein
MPALPAPLPVNTGVAGALQARGPAALHAADVAQREQLAQSQKITQEQATGLAGLIRREWDMMVNHRNGASGWSRRMLSALRQFNGQYEPQKLAEIQKFGGSTIYARLTAVKCRGASALLRDVYLSMDRPWGLEAPADADIPPEIFEAIAAKVQSEVVTLRQAGQPIDIDTVRDRTLSLIEAARQAAKKKATARVRVAEDKIETLLQEGNFYGALAEFLVDVAIFPFACVKGPVVKMDNVVRWRNGVPYTDMVPKLYWARVSPFDLWWSPGVSDIADANVIERVRFTRAELNDALDLPGYDHKAVREVLERYPNGLSDQSDMTDSIRAVMESRENPIWNQTGLLDCLEFHGNVQGRALLEYGMPAKLIPDPMRDYAIEAWLIGSSVIKVQLAPSPKKRHPYYITSFEKVPGTPVGNALPDMLEDLQEAANASLRAVNNNMAMASGPQVVVNTDRLSGMETGEEIYPWKRWMVTSDPMGGQSTANKPVEFFQPTSNVQELMAAFQLFYSLADDVSAIPRYLQGSAPGGAGRTASGLAMLMGNASKVLQTVCANIDREVIALALDGLLDMILLTDTTDVLDGTEKVVVKGVSVALQRETLRSRQLEFLAATANPIDMQIMGPKGRAAVLRPVATTLGLPGENIVPSDEDIAQQQKMAEQIAQQQKIPGHGGMGEQAAQAAGSQPPAPSGDMGPRTNLVPTRIAGGVG